LKKITILILLAIAGSTYGINTSAYGVFSKLNNKNTLKNLTTYLNADEAQTAELETIFSCTAQLLNSSLSEKDESYSSSAMNYNLTSTKSVLSTAPYRKYLIFINSSIMNENRSAKK
jgi:hypothetical protein